MSYKYEMWGLWASAYKYVYISTYTVQSYRQSSDSQQFADASCIKLLSVQLSGGLGN